MKVTTLLPDKLVHDVLKLSGGKNTTESLIIALKEWVEHKEILELNKIILKKPLKLTGVDAKKIRKLNRDR